MTTCRQLRLEQSVPILALLSEWMQTEYQQALPKSPIGKALAYSIKRWDKLSAYANEGKLFIDNNAIEVNTRDRACRYLEDNHLWQ
ncbi:transposase [Chitinophaga sp. S165]|uniref:IS66 family transposase n=1 Tax=Chitinophaga sp. S165 TaxID=2135462 RepID=UPI00351A91D7